jgi:hypothetical protein
VLHASGVRQQNFRQVFAAAIENTDIADALDDFAARSLRQVIERRVASAAFADSSADFDQFVIGQGSIQFIRDAIGQTCISYQDDRAHGMREPAQILPLFFRKRHSVGHCVDNSEASL